MLKPEFVSLRPGVSKPPDCGQTVRIFKWLISRRNSARNPLFSYPSEEGEELALNWGVEINDFWDVLGTETQHPALRA